MPKPSSHLDWAVGNPNPSVNIIEPSVGKKVTAWGSDERPPYEFFNWLFFRQDEWNKYFEQTTDAIAKRYDLVIGSGSGATHATLEAAVADGVVGPNQTVLVLEDAVINTTIVLSKARWRIEFRPGVVYSKGAVDTMMTMDAEGIELYWGRFTGYTGVSDKVIEQSVNAEYCTVSGSRFGAGTTLEVDQSAVPPTKMGPVSQTITEA